MPFDQRWGNRVIRDRRNARNAARREQLDIPATDNPLFSNYIQALNKINWLTCRSCHSKTLSSNAADIERGLCSICSHGNNKYTAENNMDPGPIPAQLQNLTAIEQMLIAQVSPIVQAHRLPRGGQFGFRGHVICFPQHIQALARSLPNLDLAILVIRRQGGDEQMPNDLFRVRRQVVLDALLWLRDNNRFYRNIEINHANIQVLPPDGNFNLPVNNVIEVPAGADNDDAENLDEGPPANHDVHPIIRPPTSFVNVQGPNPTERQHIAATLNPNHQPIDWPHIDRNNPINEYNTEGYICRAFPCLFPTGAADLNSPRDHNITPFEYFTHMLKYCDGRFQNPRFLYLAYNRLLRHKSIDQANCYVRRNPEQAAVDLNQLRNLANDPNSNLANFISHYGAAIKGSKAYWHARNLDLKAMLSQIGKPDIFWTFTFADFSCPLLHRLLPNRPGAAPSRQQLINDNPAVVDQVCTSKFETFFKHFFCKKFSVSDFWYRFEWQSRGTLHVHGVTWHIDAPDGQIAPIEDLVQYADSIVSCMNTMLTANDDPLHFYHNLPNDPCALPLEQVGNLSEHIKQLSNKVQRHFRCTPYCLRTVDEQQTCRFGFPKQIIDETVIHFELNQNGERDKMKIDYKRNDPLMNTYNNHCLAAWAANMDFNLVLSIDQVARYVAKYASKSEYSSTALKDVFKTITNADLAPNNPLKQAARKLLLSTVGDRDISAQECTHWLSNRPFYQCSRSFVAFKVDGQFIEEPLPHRNLTSYFQSYMERPANLGTPPDVLDLENISLFQFLTSVTRSNSRAGPVYKKRPQAAVVRVFPYLNSSPESPNYINYCKQRLILHKPFRNFASLTEGFANAIDAAADFFQNQADPNAALENAVRDAAQAANDEPPPQPDVENPHQDDWMRLLPLNNDDLPMNLPQPNPDFDWRAASDQFRPLLPQSATFIEDSKGNFQLPLADPGDPATLNPTQRLAFDHVLSHYERRQNPANPQLLLIILGTAGTGKSYLLNCIRGVLADSCAVLAPTGVAALNVSGHTLHSFLSLPIGGVLRDLTGQSLLALQDRCRSIRYLIIDEISMVGAKSFSIIDRRLRQAFPDRADSPFGGCSFIIIGDFAQLPPIADRRLYDTNAAVHQYAIQGHALYRLFQRCVTLDQPVRQQGDVRFSAALLRLRDGELTRQDYEMFTTRFIGSPDVPLLPDQDNIVSLFPTREQVHQHNAAKLRRLNNPIASMDAAHNIPAARAADANESGGLERSLSISVGSRVMLRTNLWIEAGLVNGSIGFVHHIVYLRNAGPPALPDFVVCTFDAYTGPSFLPDLANSVPILPLRRSWSSNGRALSRTALPLSLAWAVTIHKCQGLTLPAVSVDLGDREAQLGMSFVALSRVRSLQDLFLSPFPFDRLSSLSDNNQLAKRKQEEQRLVNLV